MSVREYEGHEQPPTPGVEHPPVIPDIPASLEPPSPPPAAATVASSRTASRKFTLYQVYTRHHIRSLSIVDPEAMIVEGRSKEQRAKSEEKKRGDSKAESSGFMVRNVRAQQYLVMWNVEWGVAYGYRTGTLSGM